MAEFDAGALEYDVNGCAYLPPKTIGGHEVICEIDALDGTPSAETLTAFAALWDQYEALKAKAFAEIKDSYHDDEFMVAYDVWFESGYLVKEVFPEAASAADITPEMTIAKLVPWKLKMNCIEEDAYISMEFGFADAHVGHYVLVEMDADGTIENILIES